MIEYMPSSGQQESPEQLVGQSGVPQRTWVNVEDRDGSNARSQPSTRGARLAPDQGRADAAGVEEHWELLLRRAVADVHAVVQHAR